MPLPDSAIAAQAAAIIIFLVIWQSLSLLVLRYCGAKSRPALPCRRRPLMFFEPLTNNARSFGMDNTLQRADFPENPESVIARREACRIKRRQTVKPNARS